MKQMDGSGRNDGDVAERYEMLLNSARVLLNCV
jgi:hypothetical protein